MNLKDLINKFKKDLEEQIGPVEYFYLGLENKDGKKCFTYSVNGNIKVEGHEND